MVDFSKLLNRTPEQRKVIQKEREEKFVAEELRVKLMVDKLYEQVENGCVPQDSFAENFILSVKARLNAGISLTDKQLAKLEQLFEQY